MYTVAPKFAKTISLYIIYLVCCVQKSHEIIYKKSGWVVSNFQSVDICNKYYNIYI